MLYFAARLNDSCVERLMATSENPIAAIELLAVVLGMRLWRSIVAECACIVFVDNDAARHALIRAYSPNLELCGLCELAAREESRGQMLCYFERVASAANIGDAPSRGIAPARVPGWPVAARTHLHHHHNFAPNGWQPSGPAAAYWHGQLHSGLSDLPVCSSHM